MIISWFRKFYTCHCENEVACLPRNNLNLLSLRDRDVVVIPGSWTNPGKDNTTNTLRGLFHRFPALWSATSSAIREAASRHSSPHTGHFGDDDGLSIILYNLLKLSDL